MSRYSSSVGKRVLNRAGTGSIAQHFKSYFDMPYVRTYVSFDKHIAQEGGRRGAGVLT